jgi:hypothetical protein
MVIGTPSTQGYRIAGGTDQATIPRGDVGPGAADHCSYGDESRPVARRAALGRGPPDRRGSGVPRIRGTGARSPRNAPRRVRRAGDPRGGYRRRADYTGAKPNTI